LLYLGKTISDVMDVGLYACLKQPVSESSGDQLVTARDTLIWLFRSYEIEYFISVILFNVFQFKGTKFEGFFKKRGAKA